MSAVSEALQSYLGNQEDCASAILFGRHGDAVISIYVGAEVITSSASDVLRQFSTALEGKKDTSRFGAQIYGPKTPTSWTVGAYADF